MSSSSAPPKSKSLRKKLKDFFSTTPKSAPEESPSGNPEASSTVADNLKISGRFAFSITPKLAGCIDGNPVKMAFNILNVIIEVRKEINDNKDQLQAVLEETLQLLSTVLAKMEMGSNPHSVINQTVEQYKTDVTQQLERISTLNSRLHSNAFNQVDYNSYKDQIMNISRKINGATNRFNIAMVGTTGMTVDELRDEKREEKLRHDLKPSKKADHRFINGGKSAIQRETCTEGTRIAVLQEITDWANDLSVDSPPAFWLTGQAGSGKTTIAYTIAKRFWTGQPTSLGASFFCSRQFEETKSLQRIVPTIAFQLAQKCDAFRVILQKVDTSDALDFHDIQEQFSKLLFQPWTERKSRYNSPTYLVVIDALDEIDDDKKAFFLEQLLQSLEDGEITGLKFLVTSRPDPDIAALGERFQPSAICKLQNVPIEDAELDIRTYLDAKLKSLRGTPEINQLNDQTAGLFIYAATVVKILTRRKLDKEEQLMLLRPLLSSISSDFGSIDELYRQIMREAFSDLDDNVFSTCLSVLHTFLCSVERISASVAADLVDTTSGIAEMLVNSLHAVLYEQDGRVYWYHTSFPDFILNRARSSFRVDNKDVVFSCDAAAQHGILTHTCFRIMNSKDIGLRFNMGDIKSSYLLDSENAEELQKNVSKNISPVLRYACMHWTHHISFVTDANNNRLWDIIFDFLQIHALFWIEAMSLLGSSGECSYLLFNVAHWVTRVSTNWRLEKDLEDVANFAGYFSYRPTAVSTPHLYISSLATWQSTSLLLQAWKSKFRCIPLDKDFSVVPLMSKPLKEEARTISFSINGKQLVVGMQTAVVVLDAATGQQQHMLSVDECQLVKYSRDGSKIVVVSHHKGYKLVCIWDAFTFQLINEFEAHDAVVSTEETHILAVSPDHSNSYLQLEIRDILTGHLLRIVKIPRFTPGYGRLIAFSFALQRLYIVVDESLEIWDTSSECALQALTLSANMHYPGRAVWAILSDGKMVACGSKNTAQVWDTLHGHLLMEVPQQGWVMALNFSYDGTYIVSISEDKKLHVWDTSTGTMIQVIDTSPDPFDIAFSPDGLRIGVGTWEGVCVWSWDPDKSKPVKWDSRHGEYAFKTSHAVLKITTSNDCQRIVSVTRNKVQAWDATTGAEVKAILTPETDHVSLSDNGQIIASHLDKSSVKVMSATTGEEILLIQLDAGSGIRYHSIILSRSGRKLAFIKETGDIWTHDRARVIEIWDISNGREIEIVMDGNSHPYPYLLFADNEQYLVGGLDAFEPHQRSPLVVWDVLTGNVITTMMSKINPLQASSNGRELAVCAQRPMFPDESDITLCEVWDIVSGECLRIIKTSFRPLTIYGENPKKISFDLFSISNDSKRIAVICSDGFIRVWSFISNESCAELLLVGQCPIESSAITFSRDDKQVICSYDDGSIRVWDVGPNSGSYEWALQESGWITSLKKTGQRLMWIPSDLKVIQPRNTLTISSTGDISIDFKGAMISEEWEGCYSS